MDSFTLDDAPPERDMATVFEEIQAALGATPDDDWQIAVRRVQLNGKKGGTEPFLFNIEPEDLWGLEERLRDEVGTGTYRIVISHDRKFFKKMTISVEAPFKPAAPATDMTAILAAIDAANKRTMDVFEARFVQLAQPAPPAVDPLAMLDKVMSIVGNMVKTTAPAPPPVDDSKSAIAMFTKGIEMASKFAPGGGGETTFLDLFRDAMKSPIVENILGNMTQKNVNAYGAQPGNNGYDQAQQTAAPPFVSRLISAAKQPILSVPPVLPPNPETLPPDQLQKLMSDQIDYLITRAINGSDPSLYAETMLDNMPQPMINYMMQNPNTLAELQAVNPKIANHIPWFTDLLAAMREMVQSSPQTEAPPDAARPAVSAHANPGRPPGNPPNFANHGAARPKV